MKIRMIIAFLLLCLLASQALAISHVYGYTETRVRVRESASTSSAILDNVEQGRLVYITDSKESGNEVFIEVKYRLFEGKTGSGWIRQSSGGETYVTVLPNDQTLAEFGVSGGTLPPEAAGVKNAQERAELKAQSSGQTESAAPAAETQAPTTAPATAKPATGSVADVQKKLGEMGIYSGDVTGNMGNKTLAAIKAFQEKMGLTPSGELTRTTLRRLDEEYAKFQSKSTASSSKATPSPVSSVDADTVRDVQQKLKDLGIYSGEVTGNIGNKTTTAIKAFQEKYGLTADGVIGNATLAKLNEVTSEKTTSAPAATPVASTVSADTVRDVQQKLKDLGIYSGEVTGNIGAKTTAAIKSFQEKYGLTADGVIGNATLAKLNEVTSEKVTAAPAATPVASTVSAATVRDVQQKLKDLGMYSGSITGNAGQKTVAAVKAFQKKYGLTADGIIGSETLKKLNEVAQAQVTATPKVTATPASSANASTVRDVQQKLKDLGMYSGDVTGNIGSKTTAAIKAFQEKYGLTADGIIGSETLKNLNEVAASAEKAAKATAAPNSNLSSSTIKQIQRKLGELGFYSGEVTGNAGNKTTAAIKAFQQKYGLNADGIAGSQTINKINSVYAASQKSTTASSSSSRRVYNLDWFKAKENKLFGHLGLVSGHHVRLTDINTGKSLNLIIQSAGNHLDVEPVSASDTQTLLDIYGVSSTKKITFLRRAAYIVTDQGYRIVCSIYGQPHGSQTVYSNKFPGQFCLHFLHSKTHGTDVVDGDHQAMIRTAVAHFGSSNVKIIRTEDDL